MTEQNIIAVPLAQLILSDTESQQERRARFNKDALVELGKSLVTTGQINPIVVRPKGKKYEIVAGERRFIAAGYASLATITCAVRELSDQQVLEVQIIENLQREDLHELAEAEAYEALVKMGRTPAQIAGQVHKDESYVRKRMRLLALGKKGRKAFYAGEITVAIAIILARIPVESLQDEALELYLDGAENYTVTAEEFRAQVQREYMTDLVTAPFNTEDLSLVPAAGACSRCPKNTLDQRQLFDEIGKKAHCTDTVCFQAKRTAHGAQLLEKAKASGREVITGKEAKRVAERGRHSLVGYHDVSGHAYGVPVKKLLKGVDPAKLKLLQLPDTGEVIEVAPAALVSKAKPEGKAASSSDKYRQQQLAQEKARQLEIAARVAIFQAIHAAKLEAVDQGGTLRAGILEFWSRTGADTKVMMRKAMGWEVKGKSTGMSVARHFDLEPFMPADQAGLWKLLRALSLASELSFYQYGGSSIPKRLNAAAAAVGVDVKKIRAGVVAARSEKAKAKKKGKK